MSRTINRVELLGRVGTDPELKYSQNGTAICQLRLATDRRRQNGETEADWHTVVCWGKQAEAVGEYVKKGNRLFVAGSLAQNSYETDDGQRRHRTEVHAQRGAWRVNHQRVERLWQQEGLKVPQRQPSGWPTSGRSVPWAAAATPTTTHWRSR